MAPSTSITTLANAAETALATYGNDQAAVATDQGNIAALQSKLTADQTTATTDGAEAYAALSALDQAIQAQMALLPQPPAIPPAPLPAS
jgi:hypothetical protein